jgi:hypothetical protein
VLSENKMCAALVFGDHVITGYATEMFVAAA